MTMRTLLYVKTPENDMTMDQVLVPGFCYQNLVFFTHRGKSTPAVLSSAVVQAPAVTKTISAYSSDRLEVSRHALYHSPRESLKQESIPLSPLPASVQLLRRQKLHGTDPHDHPGCDTWLQLHHLC